MKKLKKLLIITGLLVAASVAHAREDTRGFYLSGAGSADYAEKGKSDRNQNEGKGGALALGYYFKGPLRAEIEMGFHTFENSRFFPPNILAVRGWPGLDAGESNHLSLMTNVFYDFELKERWDIYLGAGVGAMRFSGDRIHEFNIFIFPPVSNFSHYENINRLAVQAMGGLTFHVTPRFALTAGYRVADAAKASFENTPINTGVFSSIELGVRIKL